MFILYVPSVEDNLLVISSLFGEPIIQARSNFGIEKPSENLYKKYDGKAVNMTQSVNPLNPWLTKAYKLIITKKERAITRQTLRLLSNQGCFTTHSFQFLAGISTAFCSILLLIKKTPFQSNYSTNYIKSNKSKELLL